MKLVCLFLLGFFCSVLSFLVEESGDSDAKFGSQTSAAQIININESNSGERVHVALITAVTDDLTINVLSELEDALNVQLIDGPLTETKYLTANRLDYESLADGENSILIVIVDTSMNDATLVLNILNIDDESPSLIVSTAACSMNENEVITFDNGCEFTVSDPDGFLNQMDFTNIQDDSGLFEFKYKDEPKDDDKEAKVYLVLKEGKVLDFETRMIYNVQVSPKDSANHVTVPTAIVPILVHVIDEPDEAPLWASFKFFYNIVVNTPANIQLKAIDGDIGINNPINYEIVESNMEGIVTIDEESGLVSIAPIDKSAEVIFTVRAYEKPDPDSFIEGTITVVVHDPENTKDDISVHQTFKRRVVIEEEYTSDLEKIHVPLDEYSSRRFKYDRLL